MTLTAQVLGGCALFLAAMVMAHIYLVALIAVLTAVLTGWLKTIGVMA